jgi:myosin heavy subunit
VVLAAEREIMERRAEEAEAHIEKLEGIIDNIQRALPQLESIINMQRSELQGGCQNLAIEALQKLQLSPIDSENSTVSALSAELATRDARIEDLERELAMKSEALASIHLEAQVDKHAETRASGSGDEHLRSRLHDLEEDLRSAMIAKESLHSRNEILQSELDAANSRITTLSAKFSDAEAAEQSAELVKLLTRDNLVMSETLSEVTQERDNLRAELSSHKAQVDIVIEELTRMRADPKAIDAVAVLVSPSKARSVSDRRSTPTKNSRMSSTQLPQTPLGATLAPSSSQVPKESEFVAVSFPVSSIFDRQTTPARSPNNSSELNDSIQRSSSIGSPRRPSNARKYSKFVSKLSPVVEDRVLRLIFEKYSTESKGMLRSSRWPLSMKQTY